MKNEYCELVVIIIHTLLSIPRAKPDTPLIVRTLSGSDAAICEPFTDKTYS